MMGFAHVIRQLIRDRVVTKLQVARAQDGRQGGRESDEGDAGGSEL